MMKNALFVLTFALLTMSSCVGRDNDVKQLPFEKVYILEYNYVLPEVNEKQEFKFFVSGFTELDKNFNLKYAKALYFNSDNYYNAEETVPDSVRARISNILAKYQSDTTFFRQDKSDRIYDGNMYRFILQKNKHEVITIRFEPAYLPSDLQFVFSYLYENRQKTMHKSNYNDLFDMFRNQVRDDELLPIKGVLKFTTPVITDEE